MMKATLVEANFKKAVKPYVNLRTECENTIHSLNLKAVFTYGAGKDRKTAERNWNLTIHHTGEVNGEYSTQYFIYELTKLIATGCRK